MREKKRQFNAKKYNLEFCEQRGLLFSLNMPVQPISLNVCLCHCLAIDFKGHFMLLPLDQYSRSKVSPIIRGQKRRKVYVAPYCDRM